MKYVGINPVIVHGGGPWNKRDASKNWKRKQIYCRKSCDWWRNDGNCGNGAFWEVNKGIVSDINKYGGKAVGLSGKDGNMVFVEKKFVEVDGEKVDIGFVGEIKKINTEVIKLLESNDTIPVISSIGVDKNGQTYNINADYVAGAIAGKLQADRLIFLTDVDGIFAWL